MTQDVETNLSPPLRQLVEAAAEAELSDPRELRDVQETLFREKPPARRRIVVGAALAAAAAAGLAIYLERDPGLEMAIGEAPVETGEWVSATAEPLTLRFSDASEVRLAPTSDLVVTEVHASGAEVQLARGQIAVDVTHKDSTDWNFEAGPVTIEVVGTAFEASWDPNEAYFGLKVTEGEVIARGPIFGRPVRAGEELRAWLRESRVEIRRTAEERAELPAAPLEPAHDPSLAVEVVTDESSDEGDQATVREPRHRELRGARPVESAEPPASPAALARDGLFTEAVAAVRAQGVGTTLANSSRADRIVIADAARHAGAYDLAREAYQSALSRDAAGARAAFGLARTALDTGDRRAATRWLRDCVSRAPSGPLAREARGRLMVLLHSAGDEPGARTVAREYLERHPGGPQAELARQLHP
ncbi:MAG: FecR domain-containing protein [Myxococcota bacterium]